MAVGIRPNGRPASQTLIVPLESPETIFDPSGENWTLRTIEPAAMEPASFMVAASIHGVIQ